MDIYRLHTSRCPRQMGLRRRERLGGAPDAFGGMAQRHRERRDRDRVHCSDDRRHPYIQNLANVALGWPLILMSLAWLAIGCAYIGWRGVCSEAATMPPLETCTYFVLPA